MIMKTPMEELKERCENVAKLSNDSLAKKETQYVKGYDTAMQNVSHLIEREYLQKERRLLARTWAMGKDFNEDKKTMTFLSNPNVKLLAKTFDLDLPENYLAVSEYTFEDGNIVIKKIKLLDAKGKMIRFVNNEKVLDHLSKYVIKFE